LIGHALACYILLLFLVAILVPAGVLIGLAGRIMYQDRELAAKRAINQRGAAVEQLRREPTSRLEAIKLREISRLTISPNSDGAGSPAVIVTARMENYHLVFQLEADGCADFRRMRAAPGGRSPRV
jgi:hypothetical protein